MSVAERPPEDAARGVGERIAHARHRAGFTQKALAERLGVSLWYVERLERGDAEPARHAAALAAITGEPETAFVLTANGDGEEHAATEPAAHHRRRTRIVADLRAATLGAPAGRTLVLGSLAALIFIRFFSEKIHVVPRSATFIDVPVFFLLVAVGATRRSVSGRRPLTFFAPGMAFLCIASISTLVNFGSVAPAPVIVFLYDFLSPLGVYYAVYRLWPAGNALAFSRFLVAVGVIEILVVSLMDFPHFVATGGNPDFISGTFGDNAYQLVYLLLVLTALFAAILVFEPHRAAARIAPFFFVAVAATIFLAQFRALLVSTMICVVLIGLFLAVVRGSGIPLAAILIVVFLGSLSYVASHFPTTKFQQTVSSIQANPGFFLRARLHVITAVFDVYAVNPVYPIIGTGPATYSSRAWRTFADLSQTRTAVAAHYASAVNGGALTTNLGRQTLRRYHTSAVVEGSHAVTTPFSSYAALLAEVGVLGCAALISAYVVATKQAARSALVAMRNALPEDPLPGLALAAVIAFALLLQLAFLENWLEVTRATFLAWALLAVVMKEFTARRGAA